MKRYVSLDFWNTLAAPSPVYSLARDNILHTYFSLPQEKLRAHYRAVKDRLDMEAEIHGRCISPVDCCLLLIQRIMGSASCADLENLRLAESLSNEFQRAAMRNAPIVLSETIATLRRAQRAGVGLGVISNTNFISGETLRRIIAQWGVDFTDMIFSDELSYAKPHPNIFRRWLSGKNIDECVHIGDNRVCDVMGAKSLGLDAVQIKTVEDLPQAIMDTIRVTA